MEIKDLVTWGNVPEYVLGNLWHLNIENGLDPFPIYSNYITEKMLDYSISEISFPQEELKFDKTSFGLPLLDSIEEYSTVEITYFDYVKSPTGITLPVTRFFMDWMNSLYDKYKRCVKKDWRNHYKNIEVTLSRYFKKGFTLSTIAGGLNEGSGIINSATNFLDRAVNLSIPKATFDTQEVEIAKYNIQNCYVSKISNISLNNNDDERKEFSVDLICEKVTLGRVKPIE